MKTTFNLKHIFYLSGDRAMATVLVLLGRSVSGSVEDKGV